MLIITLCCFQTFFFWCLPGDYMGITRILSINLLVCFWNFYQKKNLQNGEEANATLQKKIMKFPYPKAKQEVWDGSWASCDYVYIIYIVDKKTDGWIFLPWKKTCTSFWDWYTDKEVFRVEKKWVTWSVTKMNCFFFRSSSMKGIIHMHTLTIYIYM